MTGTGPLIRPMTPADRPALADFPNRVSAGSAIFRFHGSLTVLTDQTLNLLLDLVDGQREAITAVDDRGIAGVARFARDDLDPATAEVAILVADEWQHRGLARQLLRPLAERARSAGIERFRAEIQADNTVARRFFLGLTPTARERHRNGNVVVLINVAELLSHAGLTFARASRSDVRSTNLGPRRCRRQPALDARVADSGGESPPCQARAVDGRLRVPDRQQAGERVRLMRG